MATMMIINTTTTRAPMIPPIIPPMVEEVGTGLEDGGVVVG